MKEKLKKISLIIQKIFGWGIFISLLVSGLSFFGYLIAFFIGGNTATEICEFIYKKIYPILFYFTSVVVLLGLLSMYLKGETALKSSKKQVVSKKKEDVQTNPESKSETPENVDKNNSDEIKEHEEENKEIQENKKDAE